MEVLMTVLAYLFIAAVLAMLAGIVWITIRVKLLLASGKRAYTRCQTPLIAGMQILSALTNAKHACESHIVAIVTDGRTAAQAVSMNARKIGDATDELWATIGVARTHIDDIMDSDAKEEAMRFIKSLISLAAKMR